MMQPIYVNLDFQQQEVFNLPFDANGTGNSLSNIELGDFAANVVDTDAALAANSDSRLATQKAVKSYVDGILGATNGLILKGGLDASGTNELPTGNAGDTYKITVAGNFNGTTNLMDVGNTVICYVDSTAANTPANWIFLQSDIQASSETVVGYIEIATQVETDAETDDTRAVTPLKLATYISGKGIIPSYADSFLIADWVGASAPYSITYNAATHGLGTSVSPLNITISNSSGVEVIVSKKTDTSLGDVIIYSNVKFDGKIRVSK